MNCQNCDAFAAMMKGKISEYTLDANYCSSRISTEENDDPYSEY